MEETWLDYSLFSRTESQRVFKPMNVGFLYTDEKKQVVLQTTTSRKIKEIWFPYQE